MSATQSTLTLDRSAAGTSAAAPVLSSARIQRLNRLLELAWERGWSQRPDLDPDKILRAGAIGLNIKGFPDYSEWTGRLWSLTSAIGEEARLNPLGQTIAYGQLVRMVRQRMRLEILWKHHPEILELPVPPPIIVLGHMRAGTTRMQRMMASDDRFSATRFCDSWHPVPPRWLDWRPAKAWAILKAISLLNPQFSSIHPTSATAVDEEIGWLGLGFSSTPFDAQWHIPSFVAANNRKDAAPTYRLLKQLIQTHQWHEKGQPRPRVLKVPQFMEDIDALLSVFPEARIVHVTRDPREVVGSTCSLVANQRLIQSDDVDMAELGLEWLTRTALRERVAKKRLSKHKYPVVEVGYDQMDRDWRSSMREVYRSLGLGVTEKILNGMKRRHGNHRAGSDPHCYRLEDFGLNAGIVSRAFQHVGGKTDLLSVNSSPSSKKTAPLLRGCSHNIMIYMNYPTISSGLKK